MAAVFEVEAVVDGVVVCHVATYESAEAARSQSEEHLGPDDKIVAVTELSGLYADTRRLAAARLDQTADDGYQLLG